MTGSVKVEKKIEFYLGHAPTFNITCTKAPFAAYQALFCKQQQNYVYLE